MDMTIEIARLEASVHRAPVDVPVRTSFGTMRDRPAVFLRITDADGARGYGEVWCNFPHVGAEHRARLAEEVVAPLLFSMGAQEPHGLFDRLMARLHVLALQSGEWGPLMQVAAGIDAAIHDLAARRAGLPLHRWLSPESAPDIRAYASGIGPERPAEVAAACAEVGHRAFKQKVGFGRDTDLASLRAIRAAIGDEATLMADANQGWDLAEATARCAEYSEFDLTWIEEPLRADRPLDEWASHASSSPVPLAGGENIYDRSTIETMASRQIMRFVQPDVAKWGGVSGCMAAAEAARRAGAVYCPHFLGGGIGLIASAHLLAAHGGDGLLEMDSNPNPLREELMAGILDVTDGRIELPDRPGIGIEPDHLFD